jgi:diacylglycerol kinase family enzyme
MGLDAVAVHRIARVRLVANPIAGGGRNRREAPRFADALRGHGIESEIAFTERRGHAIELARAAGPELDAVVAVGGDGTLREVCEGLGGRLPAGLYPTGTANVLARDLGIPLTARGAAEVIRGGRAARIDAARVNGRLALFCAGVGFDAEILTRLEAARRGAISYASYAKPICQAFTNFRPPDLRVSLDDGPPETCQFLIVSNTRHYAGPWVRFGEGPSLTDGRFEVYRFAVPTRGALLVAGLRGLAGRIPGGSVARASASRVRVESAPEAPFQIDGDAAGTTPLELRVEPRSIPVLVPAGFVV